MKYMNSQEIQVHIEQFLKNKDFNAPYGILTGSHVNKKGTKYLSITFGRAATLDATIEIYNRNFLILRTSRFDSQVFKNLSDLETVLETL